jgi:hypothetical protein
MVGLRLSPAFPNSFPEGRIREPCLLASQAEVLRSLQYRRRRGRLEILAGVAGLAMARPRHSFAGSPNGPGGFMEIGL